MRSLTREATQSTIKKYTKGFAGNIYSGVFPTYVKDWQLQISFYLCLILLGIYYYRSKGFRKRIIKGSKNWFLFSMKVFVVIAFIEIQRRNKSFIYNAIEKLFRRRIGRR